MKRSVDLSKYDNSWYDPGRGRFIRAMWYIADALFLQNPLNPSSALKVLVLRLFGAAIGKGVTLKPRIHVKYPWNLEVGDHTWIGEQVWLDTLAPIRIGSNVCISQGAYLCTGNHDWSDTAFGLIVKQIIVEDGAWIGACATVLPGVTVAGHSVASACSVITRDTDPATIYAGNPAQAVRTRKLRTP